MGRADSPSRRMSGSIHEGTAGRALELGVFGSPTHTRDQKKAPDAYKAGCSNRLQDPYYLSFLPKSLVKNQDLHSVLRHRSREYAEEEARGGLF